MTDYHACSRCGVADEEVILNGDGAPDHCNAYTCLAALQRELAQARELLHECVPWLGILCEREDYDGNLPNLLRRIEDALK